MIDEKIDERVKELQKTAKLASRKFKELRGLLMALEGEMGYIKDQCEVLGEELIMKRLKK